MAAFLEKNRDATNVILNKFYSSKPELAEKDQRLFSLNRYATSPPHIRFRCVLEVIQMAVKAWQHDLVLQGFFNTDERLTLFRKDLRAWNFHSYDSLTSRFVNFPPGQVVMFAKDEPDLDREVETLNKEITPSEGLDESYYQDRQPHVVWCIEDVWVRYEGELDAPLQKLSKDERKQRKIKDPSGTKTMLQSLLSVQAMRIAETINWIEALGLPAQSRESG